MRLYVMCRRSEHKVYLSSPAKHRSELPWYFTLPCAHPQCPGRGIAEHYQAYEVKAEPGIGPIIGGAALFGIMGALVGGPIGAAIGATAGGVMGKSGTQADAEAARRFNES